MKPLIAFVFSLTTLHSTLATAGDHARQILTPEATATLPQGARFRDIALVVTENFDNAKRNAILTAIDAAGGHVYVVLPPNVMIGRIPTVIHEAVGKIAGVKLVTARAIDAFAAGVSDRNAASGLRFFNWVVSGEMAQEEDRVKDIVVDLSTLGEHNLPRGGSDLKAATSSLKTVKPLHHTIYPNDVLDGLVGIDVFFLESVDDPATPGQNEDEFTWTVQHHNDTTNRILAGFYWWLELANSRGIQPALTFVLSYYPGSYWEQQVPFEPIRRNTWPDDFDWISRVTANHGVTDGLTSRMRARSYGTNIRARTGAKNAFPVFVPYNPPGAPNTHPAPGNIAAFGWYGDYVQLLYRNGGYPVEQTGWVFAHEMGHVFYACDEYFQECGRYANCTNCYGGPSAEAIANGPGPREASMNWNCELCTPGGPTACIMHSLTFTIWTNHSTCEHTRRMIGWPN